MCSILSHLDPCFPLPSKSNSCPSLIPLCAKCLKRTVCCLQPSCTSESRGEPDKTQIARFLIRGFDSDCSSEILFLACSLGDSGVLSSVGTLICTHCLLLPLFLFTHHTLQSGFHLSHASEMLSPGSPRSFLTAECGGALAHCRALHMVGHSHFGTLSSLGTCDTVLSQASLLPL